MCDHETEKFFFFFFFVGLPCAIAACNPHLKLSLGVRLAAIGSFLLSVFAIIRVYVFGVSKYKIFSF